MVIGGMLGILDSLTGGEVIMILLVALLVIGPDRLPETARTMGQWLAKLRSMTSNLQSEVREVLDDPAMKPIRDVGEFVAAPRKKLVEFATAAEAEAIEAKRVAADAEEAAAEAEAAAAKARALAEEAAEQADQAEQVAEEAAELVEDAAVPPEGAPDETPQDPGSGSGRGTSAGSGSGSGTSAGPDREASIWGDLSADEVPPSVSEGVAERP